MKYLLAILCILTLSLAALSHAPLHADDIDPDLQKAWEELQAALKQESCDDFVKIAAPKIRCFNCLENTPEEYAQMQRFRDTEPDWYNKLYNEKIFIPARHFCEQDKDKIFDKTVWEAIKTQELKFATGITNNDFKAVILIPLPKEKETDPAFMVDVEFRQDGDRYIFDGVGTIP